MYHNCVRNALMKDGWTITHDPLVIRWGAKDMFVDLGAELFLSAEKAGRKIAVEIKSFIGTSEIQDLRNALGQFILYQDVLYRIDPERVLYLALRDTVFENIFEEPIGKLLLENNRLQLVMFNVHEEVITKWIP